MFIAKFSYLPLTKLKKIQCYRGWGLGLRGHIWNSEITLNLTICGEKRIAIIVKALCADMRVICNFSLIIISV